MASKKITTLQIEIKDLPLVVRMFELLRGAYYQSRLNKRNPMSPEWEREVKGILETADKKIKG